MLLITCWVQSVKSTAVVAAHSPCAVVHRALLIDLTLVRLYL